MIAAPAYRGQPLIMLLLILGGWVAVRMMMWDAATLAQPAALIATSAIGKGAARTTPQAGVSPRSEPVGPSAFTAATFIAPLVSHPSVSGAGREVGGREMARGPSLSRIAGRSRSPTLPRYDNPEHGAAAYALEASDALNDAAGSAPPVDSVSHRLASTPQAAAGSRWSAGAWLLVRRGGTAVPAGAFAPATYGASQAGAVLRYRLAPDSPHQPAAYARASAALSGSREREAALGLSARPLAGVPLVAAVEGRVYNQPGGSRLRPAGFVYTELPPVRLPAGLRGEFYGQAGYVGGAFATAFADGQLRVDRRVLQVGRGELRVGGGVWGGAQKGASRLDIGPAVIWGLPIGGSAGARLAIDWRFRVGGNAAPASGPAMTLSAGF